ncbi:hydroxyacylglutathione hydrolase [Allopseudospirillum japonicum]|uniref:Hydroxyacylglutathione hydrolase n=1 Tax=Allopseudospirillum japonicum TaxID=64971 RepID=A0A1H6S0J7_9GAMM|nr:hydroxyacylglutathione hydrolase [Allopseudospirillum japonicum]SEI61429.1 hydroxyacylglutathione hydrolase [Allopseudospirillum japonicum]
MLKIRPLAALDDNYIWLLTQSGSSRCWVVDPGDAQVVQRALTQYELHLEGILLTHHHSDHIDGVQALRSADTLVIGAAKDQHRLPELSLSLSAGDSFILLGRTFQVLEFPGHTLGHVGYFAPAEEAEQSPLLFCGDTLFSAGCGRLFEGSAAQMWQSLQQIMALPEETLIYATHEYTLSNLAFAQHVEPHNQALSQYTEGCRQARAANQPTLPSSLGIELAVNPFLRVQKAQVQASLREHAGLSEQASIDEYFAALRTWKDNFR